jgi:hypothetical protein
MSDTINWGQLYDAAGSDEALPANVYDVEVTKCVFKHATSGKPMFAVTFKVLAGPLAGKGLWHNITVTQDNDKAMYWFFKSMRDLGLGEAFFKTNPTNEAIAQALVGKQCRVDVGIQAKGAYAGRNEVKGTMPLGGAVALQGATTPAPAPAQPAAAPAVQPAPAPAPPPAPVAPVEPVAPPVPVEAAPPAPVEAPAPPPAPAPAAAPAPGF